MINQSKLENRVLYICSEIGYGRVLQLASDKWLEIDHNGGLVIGPCAGLTEPCGCEYRHCCEWCEGCGWLTKKVAGIKNNDFNKHTNPQRN